MEQIMQSYNLYLNGQLKNALSKDEQKKYLELSAQGSYEAKQKIFEHNLRLVCNIINKYYYNFEYDKEELFQIGSLGLWKAILGFNLEFDTEFSTYAVPMILGEIKCYLRDDNIIKISQDIKFLSIKINRLKTEYLKQNIILSTKQISKILNEPEQKIKNAINSTDYILSLEDSIPTNLEDYTILLGETIPSTDISVEEQYEKKERDLIIRKVINGLENKESLIIKKLFGIGCQRKTQMEIAAEIGISQAQVSRLYKIALKKLKYILINNLEEDFRIESVNKLTRNF